MSLDDRLIENQNVDNLTASSVLSDRPSNPIPLSSSKANRTGIFLKLLGLLIVGSGFFILFFFGGTYLSMNPAISKYFFTKRASRVTNLSDTVAQRIAPIPTASVAPATKPSLTPQQWVLYKKEGKVKNSLFVLKGKGNGYFIDDFRRVARWNNLLFYLDDSDKNKGNVQLVMLNLDTNDKKSMHVNIDVPNDYYDLSLQIVEDTLFLSIGAFTYSPGFLGSSYWLALPPEGNFAEVMTNESKPAGKGILSSHGQFTFFDKPFGDGCGGSTTSYLLNMQSKITSFFVKSTFGCLEGERSLGIDSNNRLILAGHVNDPNQTDESFNQLYTYVVGLPLANPSNKEGIIAKDEMPKDISDVFYADNKLLLFGKETYTFDLSTKVLTKVATISQEDSTRQIKSWKGSAVCFVGETDKMLDLDTKQVVEIDERCVDTISYQYSDEAEIQKKINELNLPDNYEFVLETVSE